MLHAPQAPPWAAFLLTSIMQLLLEVVQPDLAGLAPSLSSPRGLAALTGVVGSPLAPHRARLLGAQLIHTLVAAGNFPLTWLVRALPLLYQLTQLGAFEKLTHPHGLSPVVPVLVHRDEGREDCCSCTCCREGGGIFKPGCCCHTYSHGAAFKHSCTVLHSCLPTGYCVPGLPA